MILLSKERGQSHHRMHPWKAASKHLTGKWVKEEEIGLERDNLESNTHVPRARASLALHRKVLPDS